MDEWKDKPPRRINGAVPNVSSELPEYVEKRLFCPSHKTEKEALVSPKLPYTNQRFELSLCPSSPTNICSAYTLSAFNTEPYSTT
ncbi:hypothetical protein Cob_v003438 [Colletotrichum orbiculare MAFF 240422]|uniref:Uncharacterized protein n=1 Tax=Colletotrichum orbiculare (strain 104-T / ATCC 96160 / CBS 514.97 / LARS 414 / MAFF 240422) TaxID=1213857 RepID=A0A484G191_COLOR|nr:hypothetical protein Cob_v003438 [Colletotrichum orbiculare MAFF 240422]